MGSPLSKNIYKKVLNFTLKTVTSLFTFLQSFVVKTGDTLYIFMTNAKKTTCNSHYHSINIEQNMQTGFYLNVIQFIAYISFQSASKKIMFRQCRITICVIVYFFHISSSYNNAIRTNKFVQYLMFYELVKQLLCYCKMYNA